MCESGPSSKWGSVARHNPNPWIKERGLREHDEQTQQYICDYVLTPKLKEISFGGGEPLMNPLYFKYLNVMLEKDIAKNIKFKMITNGSFELSDIWKSALQKFEEVEIMFSIDGTYSNYEYIRTHADFNTVIKNAQEIRNIVLEKNKNAQFGITYCAQALNAHRVISDQKWFHKNMIGFDQNGVEWITHPSYMSISVLKPELMEKYDLHEEINNFTYSENDYIEFLKFNAFWDKVNNTSLEEQNPDFLDEKYYPSGRTIYKDAYNGN